MINATIEQPAPVTPPATVVLTMSEDIARDLFALLGGMHVARNSNNEFAVMSGPIPPHGHTKPKRGHNGWMHMQVISETYQALKSVLVK